MIETLPLFISFLKFVQIFSRLFQFFLSNFFLGKKSSKAKKNSLKKEKRKGIPHLLERKHNHFQYSNDDQRIHNSHTCPLFNNIILLGSFA